MKQAYCSLISYANLALDKAMSMLLYKKQP